jgi:hypothetical protein
VFIKEYCYITSSRGTWTWQTRTWVAERAPGPPFRQQVVSRDDEQAHRGVKLEDASSMRTISTPLPSAARSKFAAAQEIACESHSAASHRLDRPLHRTPGVLANPQGPRGM